jgi:hypothetical protein
MTNHPTKRYRPTTSEELYYKVKRDGQTDEPKTGKIIPQNISMRDKNQRKNNQPEEKLKTNRDHLGPHKK